MNGPTPAVAIVDTTRGSPRFADLLTEATGAGAVLFQAVCESA